MTARTQLRLPRLEDARGWLRLQQDGDPAGASTIQAAVAAQRPDGSWGDTDDPRTRILPSLWRAKLLAELGPARSDPSLAAGVDFLARAAHASSGVFSVDGSDGSVLSCYVGIAAETYLLGERSDLARPQIEWILRHQEVRVRGASRRAVEVSMWDERLRRRYGGCMARTTCLIGLVKTGRALRRWLERETDSEAAELLATIRETLLERRLMYGSDGSVVPLGGTGGQAQRWLKPAFPLDWHTDLIEVLDLVTGSGPADERMQPALDTLAASQLADGSWPLRVTFPPPGIGALERRSTRSGSPFVTARMVGALSPLGA